MYNISTLLSKNTAVPFEELAKGPISLPQFFVHSFLTEHLLWMDELY